MRLERGRVSRMVFVVVGKLGGRKGGYAALAHVHTICPVRICRWPSPPLHSLPHPLPLRGTERSLPISPLLSPLHPPPHPLASPLRSLPLAPLPPLAPPSPSPPLAPPSPLLLPSPPMQRPGRKVI